MASRFDPVTLVFRDEELERRYQTEAGAENLPFLRLGMSSSIGVWLAFVLVVNSTDWHNKDDAIALTLAVLVGLPLGIVAGLWRKTRLSGSLVFVSVLGISTPSSRDLRLA